ncbi:MAG: alpha/beta fold hydrolase [Clostridia bacterium]|nr:alpha/beta fold hydrolase [Clostridia bacterium]
MIDVFKLQSREHDMVCIMEYKNMESKGKNILLVNHGFTGHKIAPHRMLVNLSRILVDEEITVVRFDFVGSGDSEEDFHYMTIPGEVEDSKKVAQHLRENFDADKLVILGYSMGGCVASLTAVTVNVDGLILWSPISNPYLNFRHLLGEKLFNEGKSGQDIDFLGDRVGLEFFVGLEAINPIKELESFDKPICIIHGDADIEVLPDNAKAYEKVSKNTKLHFVSGAGHSYDTAEFQLELFLKTKEYLMDILQN